MSLYAEMYSKLLFSNSATSHAIRRNPTASQTATTRPFEIEKFDVFHFSFVIGLCVSELMKMIILVFERLLYSSKNETISSPLQINLDKYQIDSEVFSSMVFVEREKFLSSMSRMFQSNREGTVRMSVKPYDGQDRPTPKDGSKAKWNKEKLVLIRVCHF